MKQPSKKELEVLNHLWKLKRGYLKDVIGQFEDPKPAYTTVATMINRMIEKKFIGFKLNGRDKEYYPLLNKSTYFSGQLKKMVLDYFNNSPAQFASFFTKDSDLSLEQLEELRNLVDEEISIKIKGS